jgi:hypothetical protein
MKIEKAKNKIKWGNGGKYHQITNYIEMCFYHHKLFLPHRFHHNIPNKQIFNEKHYGRNYMISSQTLLIFLISIIQIIFVLL